MVEIKKVSGIEFKQPIVSPNTILLSYDTWDDFGYKTTLLVKFFNQYGALTYIGRVHIYNTHMDEIINPTWEDRKIERYLLDGDIDQLNNSFCSLGGDLTYYENLVSSFPDDYVNILTRLRDIAYSNDLWETYSVFDGVRYSLLRSSSAYKARKEAYNYLCHITIPDNDMSFEYEARVPYSNISPRLKFNFKRDENLPYRINAIIGKNGVGKTHIIQDLAIDISGFAENESDWLARRDHFVGPNGMPSFNKVISFSFSAFDPFIKKRREDSLCSYVYCGIQSENGVYPIEQIRENIKENIKNVVDKDRFGIISKIMAEIFHSENNLSPTLFLDDGLDSINLSSGETVLLYSMTEAVLQIEKESIILFDEPELHLHPNAIANTMRMLNFLLEEYDSYAIISTHSPIILQEIPSKNVIVLQRVNDVPYVGRMGIENFGESISLIIRDAFHVSQDESFFQTIFVQMKEKGITKEEIKSFFNGKLGLNALMTLEEVFLDD